MSSQALIKIKDDKEKEESATANQSNNASLGGQREEHNQASPAATFLQKRLEYLAGLRVITEKLRRVTN